MSDEILSRIGEWCEAGTDLELDGTTVTVAGDPPVAIEVETGDEAVVLGHSHQAGETAEGFAEQAADLLGGRGSMIEGDVETDDAGTRVEIRYPIYLDGLNRQTFLLAVRDITGTADALAEIAGPSAADESGIAVPAAADGAEDAEDEAEGAAVAVDPEPLVASGAEAADAPDRTPTETLIVDQAPRWLPTHTVPGGGLSAWAEPDPALAPVAKLEPRVELQVTEQRGAWVQVEGSNGWTGWVDGRKLRPLGTAAPSGVPGAAPGAGPAPAAGAVGTANRPGPLLGGLAMIVSAFIPWNATGFGTTANGD